MNNDNPSNRKNDVSKGDYDNERSSAASGKMSTSSEVKIDDNDKSNLRKKHLGGPEIVVDPPPSLRRSLSDLSIDSKDEKEIYEKKKKILEKNDVAAAVIEPRVTDNHVTEEVKEDGREDMNDADVAAAAIAHDVNTTSMFSLGTMPASVAIPVDEEAMREEMRIEINQIIREEMMVQPAIVVIPIPNEESTSNQNKKEGCCKRKKCWIIAIITLILISTTVVAIVVPLTLLNNNDDEREKNKSDTNDQTNNNNGDEITSFFTYPSSMPTNMPSIDNGEESTPPSIYPSSMPTNMPSKHVSKTVWAIQGKNIVGDYSYDQFGSSVSLSGDGTAIAIGAPGSHETYPSTGQVRIYKSSLDGNTEWYQLGDDINSKCVNYYYYDDDDGAYIMDSCDEKFGYSVSLSADGTVVAIASPWSLINRTNMTGGVARVYELQNNSWYQLGGDMKDYTFIENYDQNEGFTYPGYGLFVDLSSDGKTVAIASPGYHGTDLVRGHVRIYSLQDNDWSQLGDDINGEYVDSKFGSSVSLSANGKVVAIGAIWGGYKYFPGTVRVYSFQNNDWSQVGDVINGEGPDDLSGFSVSLSFNGTILAIGAPYNDEKGDNSGHVKVYSFKNNNSWSQLGEDIDGEDVEDWSGASVSLSDDGTIVAIGAPNNDKNGYDSGHVKVYVFEDDAWSQLGKDIFGQGNVDLSGSSVTMSSDGKIIAIGSPNGDGNEMGTGYVEVYSFRTDKSLD